MKKVIHDAIILSTTYGESEREIVQFLNHLCENCTVVLEKYNVLPVLVFEQSEFLKFRKIKKYFKEKNLVVFPKILINQNSKGFSACLNYGIQRTNSNFIIRLDTDDRLDKNRLYLQIDQMYKNDLDICSSYMKDQKGKILKYPKNLSQIFLMTSLGCNPIAHPSVCVRRNIFIDAYNEELVYCEDFELWIRLFFSKSLRFRCLNQPLTKYNILRSREKDKINAYYQLRIRLKFLKKLIILFFPLLIGIIPNILRIIFKGNFLLSIRRRI